MMLSGTNKVGSTQGERSEGSAANSRDSVFSTEAGSIVQSFQEKYKKRRQEEDKFIIVAWNYTHAPLQSLRAIFT
jgi:hypothetical protein